MRKTLTSENFVTPTCQVTVWSGIGVEPGAEDELKAGGHTGGRQSAEPGLPSLLCRLLSTQDAALPFPRTVC